LEILPEMTQNYYPEALPTKTATLLRELKAQKPEFLNTFLTMPNSNLCLDCTKILSGKKSRWEWKR